MLTIVDEQTRYFLAQVETKIMNERWASYRHHRIPGRPDLPPDLRLQFIVHHNQVVRPHSGGINPYHLAFRIRADIGGRRGAPDAGPGAELGRREERGSADRHAADQTLFAIREVDRDASFLRRFLTEPLMRDLNLFEHERRDGRRMVSRLSDHQNWEQVRHGLLRQVGMATVPVIRVIDADFGPEPALHLRHEHGGRDLDPENAETTLAHLYRLWTRKVCLETQVEGERLVRTWDQGGLGRQGPSGRRSSR